MLSIRDAILGVMSLRPNMPISIGHLQRSIFLIEVGFFGDPKETPTGFNFYPGLQGPVSHDVHSAVVQLAFDGRLAVISGKEIATYISVERGYAEGLAIVSSLSSVRRYGFIETITWVQNCSLEELAASFRNNYPEFCSNELQEEKVQDET